MKIVYADAKTEECCESMRKAEKFFGGNRALALSLHARINALRNAVTVRDIKVSADNPFCLHRG